MTLARTRKLAEHRRLRLPLQRLNEPFWDIDTRGNVIFAVFSELYIKKSA